MRWLLPIGVSCIFGCATTRSTSAAEVEQLRAEVRALSQENARLSKRLERLEVRAGAESRKTGQASSAPPELAVVKLKPRLANAPELPTDIDVAEPPDDAVRVEEASESLPIEVDAAFEKGMAALNTGNLHAGIEILERFAQGNQRHAQADNALFFAGVGQMGLEDYAGAAKTFERVLAQYPAGDAIRESLMKLGECYLKLRRVAAARDVFARVARSFEGTEAAAAATSRLKTLAAVETPATP